MKRNNKGILIQFTEQLCSFCYADMFLVGTAMFMFGVGLYVIFVEPKNLKENGQLLPGSNLFGLYHLKVSLSFKFAHMT